MIDTKNKLNINYKYFSSESNIDIKMIIDKHSNIGNISIMNKQRKEGGGKNAVKLKSNV